MNFPFPVAALLLVAATALAGCADATQHSANSYATPYRDSQNRNGTVESIQFSQGGTGHTSGAGAVIGGLMGAVLGHQVGGGNGRSVATVAGAVGGAVVGNRVEQNRNTQEADMYQIRVHLDNGDSVLVVQDSADGLRAGTRVQLVDGRVYRN